MQFNSIFYLKTDKHRLKKGTKNKNNDHAIVTRIVTPTNTTVNLYVYKVVLHSSTIQPV